MRKKSLNQVIASEQSSIKEVMRLIDRSGIRVAYIVDREGKLAGAVSDGEIRRSILKGKDIKDQVKNIVNPAPVVLKEKEIESKYATRRSVKKILERMPDSRFILVVDKDRRPKQIMAIADLLEKDAKVKKDDEHTGKSVLVVGGAGYLGSALARQLLNRGYKVRVLDTLMFGRESIEELLPNKRFEFIEGDMRNISTMIRALAEVDAVINLAAVVGDPACSNKPEMAIETNYFSNKALAEACKYHQINRFIYSSTCSVYGAMNGDKELDESSPLNPVSLYARSKIHSEEGILDLEDENFSPAILRMSTLYGYSPRMRFDLVVNTMTKNAVVDRKIVVHGGGQQWRPLLHVEDAAQSYIRCLEAPLKAIKGGVFNVGSQEQNYQIYKIAEAVKECVPQAEVINEGEVKDRRNYFVSFSRVEKKLKFKVTHQLKESILVIKDAIESGKIKNVDDPKYYNVEYNK